MIDTRNLSENEHDCRKYKALHRSVMNQLRKSQLHETTQGFIDGALAAKMYADLYSTPKQPAWRQTPPVTNSIVPFFTEQFYFYF
jgi:hypothetical protein